MLAMQHDPDCAVEIVGPTYESRTLASDADWQELLQQVCAYRNEQVIFRFCRHFAVSREEAESILRETLKWLWLCEFNRQHNPEPIVLRIDRPVKIIDEMWHNLVLHTQDYIALCKHYFGAYVHHFPATRRDHADFDRRKQAMPETEFLEQQRNSRWPQYSLVYDQLGEETFKTWYVRYPREYTEQAIKELRL